MIHFAHRIRFMVGMKAYLTHTIFHYIQLQSSPAGKQYGRTAREMTVNNSVSERFVGLRLCNNMQTEEVVAVIQQPLASIAQDEYPC